MTDQVSKPVLFALVATIVLALVWFVAMRPGDETAAAPPSDAPPVAAAAAGADAIDAAQVAAAPPAAPATPAAPGTSATGAPAPAAPAAEAPAASAPNASAPDPEASKRAAGVLADLERDRTVVLLFWDGKSSDDRAAKRAVDAADRLDGDVRVVVERLSHLSAYGNITNGVRVGQSPTTLVIDSERRVQAITGYTVSTEIDQAVADARGRAR